MRQGKSLGFLLVLVAVVFFTTPAIAVDQRRGGELREPIVQRIVVGLEEYQLLAYNRNNEILFHFPITIGVDTGPTPIGRFKITSRLQNPWYTPDDKEALEPGSPENPLGSRWMGINKPHYGFHGTNEPGVIRTRDSEGCVRLRNRDIEKLYRHVPRGTPVVIRERLDFSNMSLRRVQHQPKTEESKQES